MATSLISAECRSSAEANDFFATRQGLLILRQTHQYCSMLSFTIPSGCYGLVTRHRADFDYMDEHGDTHAVWPAGLHFPYPPWVGVSYLITKQSTVFHLILDDCRTKDDITVDIDVVVTFRIMGDPDLGEDSNLVRKFVYELTPGGLERQLRDAVGEIARDSVRSIDHTEIYGMRSSINEDLESVIGSIEADESDLRLIPLSSSSSEASDSLSDILPQLPSRSGRSAAMVTRSSKKAKAIVNTLNERFNSQGVQILSVAIKNVLLPQEVQSQMEDEALSISARAEDLIHQEDAVRSTHMEDEIQAMIQRSRDNLQQEDQAALLRTNLQKVQLNDEMSQAKKSATEVREESGVRIQKFIARKEYEVQSVQDMTTAAAASIEMKTKSLTIEQIADAKKMNQYCLADAQLIAAKEEAEAERVMAEAEKKTASWVKRKKDFITSMKHMNVYDKLAGNEDLIVSAASDESISLLAVGDSILNQDIEKSDALSPTSVASEVALLKQIQPAEGKKKYNFEISDTINEENNQTGSEG